VLRAVVLTQYRRVTDGQTDGQTDGIAVASTALAMRALRRAVKNRMDVSREFYLQKKNALATTFECTMHQFHEQEGQHPLTGQCAPPISGGT